MTARLTIPVGMSARPAELRLPQPGHGVVIIADGMDDDALPCRLHETARRLQHCGLGTLLFQTPGSLGAAKADTDNDADAGAAGDADALARRLLQGVEALPVSLSGTPIGLLGCGEGAAAVLLAAARRPDRVRAAVCCAGRFVAADPVLADLRVPTMLMAGAADPEGVDEARRVHALLRCQKRIDIVPRASRRFLEAGTVELATERAADWFCSHLSVAG